jgi:hypothetical protein
MEGVQKSLKQFLRKCVRLKLINSIILYSVVLFKPSNNFITKLFNFQSNMLNVLSECQRRGSASIISRK